MVRPLMLKKDFMKKYAPSPATYARRMKEFRALSQFSNGYISPTGSEVWIDEEIYQRFLVWKSENRLKK